MLYNMNYMKWRARNLESINQSEKTTDGLETGQKLRTNMVNLWS